MYLCDIYFCALQVILAVGGMGRRDPTGTPSIELYNPATRQWRTLTQMATGRWGAGLVSLGNGDDSGTACDEVYLVGGSNESSRLSSVLVYNVSSDQWTAMAEMSVARNGVGVVATGGKSPLPATGMYGERYIGREWRGRGERESRRRGERGRGEERGWKRKREREGER